MTKAIDEKEAERHRAKMAKRKAVQDDEVAGKTMEKGLLIVHTGTGKGKSTAAFGLALRMLGRGKRVGVVQFIKGAWHTAERDALAKFGDQISWHTMGERRSGALSATQSHRSSIAGRKRTRPPGITRANLGAENSTVRSKAPSSFLSDDSTRATVGLATLDAIQDSTRSR